LFGRLSKIERAYRRHPSAPLFARFAETCLGQGDPERALAVCLEGCERFPNYPTGLYLLSRSYQAGGDLEEARAALDKSLRLDAENPRGFELLAQIYAELGIRTLALKCMKEAARLDPFDEDIGRQFEQLSAEEAPPPAAAEPISVETTAVADDHRQTQPLGTQPFEALAVEALATPEAGPNDADSSEDVAPLNVDEENDAPSGAGEEEMPVIAVEIESVADDLPGSQQLPDVVKEATESVGEPEETGIPLAEPEESSASLDEPFGVLNDLPEWETATPPPPLPEPVIADTQAPVSAVEPDGSDEVAALGAGLFGLESPEDEAAEPVHPSQEKPLALEVKPTKYSESVSFDTVTSVETGAADRPGAVESDDAHALETLLVAAAAEAVISVSTARPEPAVGQPTSAAGALEEPTGADVEPTVSRFSRAEDTEMIALLREFDCEVGNTPTTDGELPAPIATTTLAELYSVQGFVDRAIETYRQVLAAQPDNETARARLTVLERSG